MIIGIAVDDWKLPVFRKHLETANYLYTEHRAMKDVTLMKVSCNTPDQLAMLVMDANKECARTHCPSCED